MKVYIPQQKIQLKLIQFSEILLCCRQALQFFSKPLIETIETNNYESDTFEQQENHISSTFEIQLLRMHIHKCPNPKTIFFSLN